MKKEYIKLNQQQKSAGNMIVAVVMFIAIMSSLLKMCYDSTLQENRLTSMFEKETQINYVLENMLHLGRDYIKNFITDPYLPNSLLTTNSLTKFNCDFSKNQIIPDEFNLDTSALNIDCGPVLFEDKKKDATDERYKAELILRAKLTANIPVLGNWTLNAIQTVELERNPLCDFQIFSEGDTSFLAHRAFEAFAKPVHINGNCRFDPKANCGFTFNKKLSIAGHVMKVDNSSISLYNENLEPDRTCNNIYATYSPNPSSSGYVRIPDAQNNTKKDYSSGNIYYTSNSYSNKLFEKISFERWHGGLITRGNVIRPSGFDPTMFAAANLASPDTNHTNLENALGVYNITDARSNIYNNTTNRRNVNSAVKKLRMQNLYSGSTSTSSLSNVVQKLALVESQRLQNQPGINVSLKSTATDWPKLSCKFFAIESPYVLRNLGYEYLYCLDANKTVYMYEDISLADKLIIDEIKICTQTKSNQITITTSLPSYKFYQTIEANKLAYYKLSETTRNSSDWQSVFKTNKNVVSSSSSPELNTSFVYLSGKWQLSSSYKPNNTALYDHNRRMAIQILDFDVGAFITKLNELKISCQNIFFGVDASDHMSTSSFINTFGQNHKSHFVSNSGVDMSTADIRINYQVNRTNFISTVFNDDGKRKRTSTLFGLLNILIPNNFAIPQEKIPIGVGIRIINAKKLPSDGLTISSLFPIYIQGDFNTQNINQKACICSDCITVLSSNFKDEYSIYPPASSSNKPSSSITINAHIITGTPSPAYMPTVKNTHNLIPEAGFFGGIKILEDWGNHYINIGGSLLLPFKSKIQWEPFVPLITNSISYNQDLPRLKFTNRINGTPAGMPFYHKITRGSRTKIINEQQNTTLTTVYNANWNNYPLSTYKYNIAPIIN